MASSVCSSRESRPTHNSLAGSNNPYAAINNDSKARHLLGLSRTELHSARTESLTSKSSSTINDISPVDRSSIRNRLARRLRKPTGAFNKDQTKPNAGVSEALIDRESNIVSKSHTTSLASYPSTSSLRSSHDIIISPVVTSEPELDNLPVDPVQPTSDSVMPHATDQEMEYARQRRYFRSPRLRSIREGDDFDKEILDFGSDTDTSPHSSGSSLNYRNARSPGVTRVQLLSPPLRSTTPLSSYQSDTHPIHRPEPRATLRKKNSTHATLKGLAVNTPYVKVHVRRPKAGTKHWFDDLEGVSSDEEYEANYDFEVEPRFDFVEDDFVFENDRTQTPRPVIDRPQHFPEKKQVQINVIEAPESSPEIERPSSRPASQRRMVQSNSNTSLVRFSPQANPLVRADLSQESVLNLSLSDDEQEDEVFRPVQPTEPVRQVRQSVADDFNEDSEVEIHLAQTVRAVGPSPGKRPSPIQILSPEETNPFSPSPLTASPWRYGTPFDTLHTTSMLSDVSELRDIDEDILLKSFPATPTEANRPRSSVSLSEDKSAASMRMMKVTRQEENLIAAMRLKRAAMKRAEKAAARNNLPRLRDDTYAVPSRQPSLSEYQPYSPEGDRPVTAFVPDSRGRGSSEIPLLVEFQDRIQRGDHSSAYHKRRISGNSSGSYGPFPRLHSTLASPSSPESQQRDSNVVVLDNVNSELPRRAFPAQLFMESPFATWDRSPIVQ